MNIIDKITMNSELYPYKIAYEMVEKNETVKNINYYDLKNKIDEVSGNLAEYNLMGERVIIMLPHSIEYIISFFGALKSYIVAVPAYPVTKSYHKERLQSIIESSGAAAIITDEGTREKLIKLFSGIEEKILILDVMELKKKVLNSPWSGVKEGDTAYLQYTSGSTSNAKGVIITHKNIIANLECIERTFDLDMTERFVSWLPIYHDMGLIGNFMMSVYLGASCYFMNSFSFIKSPGFWLETVSKVKGTFLSAPNFAYQMCIDEVSEDELKKQNINLKSLKCVVNGAEPVRLKTMQKFIEKYAKYGLSELAMKPSYGLAENTLLVTTYDMEESYKYCHLNQSKLSNNIVEKSEEGVAIVSSGKALDGILIKIVVPDQSTVLCDKEIGEIVISSDSTTPGYWNVEKSFLDSFRLEIDGNVYFRTGDLGFFNEGYIYIVGRKKDLIIIRGKNYYPQDIELTIENTSIYLKKDASAAFGIMVEEEEKLVVVLELDKRMRRRKDDSIEKEEEKKRIRETIIHEVYKEILLTYNIEPYDIVLIQEKSIPKTSSGKIQRQQCKKLYLDKKLIVWEGKRR